MQCPGCSKVLPSQVQYCAYCGVGVSPPPRPGLGRKALLILGCVLLLSVGLMVGRWTVPNYPEEKQQLVRDKQGLEAERRQLAEERKQFEADRSRDKTAEAGGGKAALTSETPAPTPASRSQEPQVAVVVPPTTPPVPPSTEKAWRNSIGMEFVRIAAGEFLMGSNDSDDEKPVHRVRISKAVYLGKYEVTQAQWQAVTGDNPSRFKGDTLPVEQVSWEDAQKFIERLNTKEGGPKYRLPTEAEWEYAARAGTTASYSFGDNTSQLGEYAWFSGNSGNTTHPVGQKKSNPWGLYDMHGNVWEWVQDWYSSETYKSSTSTAVDPKGFSTGSDRLFRGGGWRYDARGCRSAYRGGAAPGFRVDGLGFRLLREVP